MLKAGSKFKLNTDDSSLCNPELIGAKGLIWDCNGHWGQGFSQSIGISTSLITEICAIRDGYSWQEIQRSKISSQIGCKLVRASHYHLTFLYRRIRTLCLNVEINSKLSQLLVQHIFTEANKCNDALVRERMLPCPKFCVAQYVEFLL